MKQSELIIRIDERVKFIHEDVKEVKKDVKRINGTVKVNSTKLGMHINDKKVHSKVEGKNFVGKIISFVLKWL